ncbi:monovalent cation/H+ antiporter subunit A [Bordetella sp. J329]|jgi:multicomponent K+:H+ antiporter subunit A|uniref:monovalent cation/H+ antiporter subunit A n=1 Tax=Kerstersia gyiorum TaxID=206506 RepID=UPI000FDC4D02|nr:monovalent cation/H+ antiporter subunit A [Kerstersia gyiorum]AZV93401.1 monovalent cation/H+ antiporter subunit A [Bordetella sp. J329]MCH4271954.1 monovalent cation/H+ antiporter subunit A [Kerstersia gyiorum]MCI1229578.1 monovalent cation/H+ antiporter subunit A [Kerstersia gyiorum]
MRLLLLLILPFVASLVVARLPRDGRSRESWAAGLVAAAGLLLTLSLYPSVTNGGVVHFTLAWAPTLGLDFSLRMDGLAWMFALMVTGIGVLVTMYARYYMSPQDPVPRFFAFLLVFMGAMLGVVLSGNLIQLALFWELTSLASFFLISYWYHRSDARQGARMALTVTATGGLCLLAGVLLLGHIVGSYDLDTVLASGALIRQSPLYLPALILVALGALTKSAQFPFHFWLPHAMSAPTPVSAYLHSATMVKAGVFLLLRLSPALAGTDAWFWLIGGAGMVTLVLGAYAAIFQTDMKGVLAYSTISHLGLITLMLGMDSPLATVAAIFHILNHATFKASLFMAVGIVDHETGTRDIRRLNGLRHCMPITATLATVAAAAMAGVPLLNGFLSKEMFFSETLFLERAGLFHVALPVAATVAAMGSVIYSLRMIHQVFFGPLATDLPRTPHEAPRWMRFPIEMLVLACLIVGIVPAWAVGPMLQSAAISVLGDHLPAYSLAIWHGFNMPLIMSILALAGGVAVYVVMNRHLKVGEIDGTPLIYGFDGKRTYEHLKARFTDGAAWLLRYVSTDRLQQQILCILLVALLAGVTPFMKGERVGALPGWHEFDPLFALMWLFGAACAVGVAFQAKYHRLAALIMLSGTGLVTVMTFAWLSAPDLALTQLGVEIVTTVLILLGLRWLPMRVEQAGETQPNQVKELLTSLRRLRDLAIAVLVGLGMAGLAYIVMTHNQGYNLSNFFLQAARPLGHGNNVVNVILVDFRGFDTLGEITVLCAVALTVYALLRRFRPAMESLGRTRQQVDPYAYGNLDARDGDLPLDYLMVPAVVVRLLLPMAGMVSIYLLLRGHNLPGGGFVGGLVMAMAILLQYMVGGTAWVESRMRLRPQHWIGGGLLLAALTGALSWLAGSPYMDSMLLEFSLPLFGKIALGTVLLFDIGVYMLVVGSTVLMLVALAHQSARSQRARAAMAENAAEEGA